MRDVPQLKPIREGQGWSQRTLAARSGVAQNTISQLERGERKAMPSTVRKLAEALGVDPSVLLAEVWIDMFIPRGQKPSEDHELQLNLEKLRRLGRSLEEERAFLAQERKLDRERELDQERAAAAAASRPIWELEGERVKEENQTREEWYDTGRWAEYYVSGELVNRAIAFAASHATGPLTAEDIASRRSNTEERYLQDIISALRSHLGDLAAVRSRLRSNDPIETVQAARLVLGRAKRIAEEHEDYLRSFRRIPGHYYADPTARSRILKLQEALLEQRVAAAEAVQALLDLYDESLATLEDQIVRMRKEGEVLEEFVMQAHDWGR
jgi:transcriptional regulator with XRE-family HTH domain